MMKCALKWMRPVMAGVMMAGVLALIVGCGVGTLSTVESPLEQGAVSVGGNVHGGYQAVTGATVTLWLTASTGSGSSAYGNATNAVNVMSTTTGANGNFQFASSFNPATYNCSSATAPLAYLTAYSGDPTGTYPAVSGNFNNNILLVAALGPCNNISGSTSIIINEQSTAAAAAALHYFSSSDSNGNLYVTSSSANYQGLKDAFANAVLLVGTISGSTPFTSGTGTIIRPVAQINTISNILSACVNTTGSSSTACTNLYNYTTPPGGTAPVNLYQAAGNIAQYPGSNVSNLYTLQSSGVHPFSPYFNYTSSTTTATNDLSIGVAYTDNSLAAATASNVLNLAIDGNDNVWLLGATSTNNLFGEVLASSTAASGTVASDYTSTIAASHNLRNAAFDTGNNLWLSDGSAAQLYEFTSPVSPTGAATAQVFTSLSTHLAANDYTLAIDGSNNVFTTSYKAQAGCASSVPSSSGTKDCEFLEAKYSAGSYTPTNTFSGSQKIATTVRGMAADARSGSSQNGYVWATNYGTSSGAGNTVQVLAPSTGTVSTVTVGAASSAPWGIALDGSSGAWITTNGTAGLYYVAAGGTSATAATAASPSTIPNANTSAPATDATTPLAVGGLAAPNNVAIDGKGNVFTMNGSYGTVVQYSPSLSEYLSPYYGFSPSVSLPAASFTITNYSYSGTKATITVSSAMTGSNSLQPGQSVTISGATPSSLNGTYAVTATSGTTFTYASTQTAASGTASGTASTASSTQAIFTCTAATGATCNVAGGVIGTATGVAIDKAGSVWTVGSNGTALQMIGVAAPTDPVQADGKYATLP